MTPRSLFLLCSGLDSVRRGYETHMRRLFDVLREDHSVEWTVTLVKRDGEKREDEIALRVPSRSSRLVRFLARFRGDSLYWESIFFAFAFLLRSLLTSTRVDRIYSPEPVVAKTLHRLRVLIPGRPQVLFMHGVWIDPIDYVPHADRIQEVSVVNHARSARFAPDKPIALIPHFDASADLSKAEALSSAFRHRHALGERKILLNVGIVGREHKRTDHLVREAARIPDDWMVLVCGPAGEPEILDEGRALLGERFRHLSLSQDEMTGAYASASLFVHCAKTEGFGIVIIEAMKWGLPVLVHDGGLFRWVVKDPEQYLDMGTPGLLEQRLHSVLKDPDWLHLHGAKNRDTFRNEYTWQALREQYSSFLFG